MRTFHAANAGRETCRIRCPAPVFQIAVIHQHFHLYRHSLVGRVRTPCRIAVHAQVVEYGVKSNRVGIATGIELIRVRVAISIIIPCSVPVQCAEVR